MAETANPPSVSDSSQNQPIGIFDSGIGGLTVFREIAKILPQEDLLYLGDTARVPYGTKSVQTVTRYAIQNVQFLLHQKVKMIVVACNTASAFALEELQSKFSIPILGVIEPGANRAIQASRSQRIGIIGTEGTIQSESYRKVILKKVPDAFVVGEACPLFVPLVEEGWWEGEIVEGIARRYLENLLSFNIDTLILGCTHYPLLKKVLRKIVGGTKKDEVALVDSAEEIAREVVSHLTRKNLLRMANQNPKRKFYVTDLPERFRRVGNLLLNNSLEDVEHVEIT